MTISSYRWGTKVKTGSPIDHPYLWLDVFELLRSIEMINGDPYWQGKKIY